jgi:hypothetical protein
MKYTHHVTSGGVTMYCGTHAECSVWLRSQRLLGNLLRARIVLAPGVSRDLARKAKP